MSQTSEDYVRRMLMKDHWIDWVVDSSGWTRRAVEEIHAELERDQLLPGLAKSPIQPPAKVIDPPHPSRQPEPAQPLRVVQNPAPASVADLTKLRAAAVEVCKPTAESKAKSNTATELLVRADKIDDKRVQGALGRARKALIDLAAEMNRYDDQAEARAEVDRLERELAEAKARLRGQQPQNDQQAAPSDVANDVPSRAEPARPHAHPGGNLPTTVDYPIAEVRAWAREQGLPYRGRFLKREVVDAWRAAMEPAE